MNIKNRFKYIIRHIDNIGFFPTLSYFIQRIILKKNQFIRLKIRNIQYPVYLRCGTYDINIFYQIFISKELDFPIEKDLSSIFDLGANIGLSSVFLINKYPNSKILSVEPDLDNYNILQKNVKKYSSILTLNAAIYSSDSLLKLVDVGEGEASYQIKESYELNEYHKVLSSVKCYSISSLMRQFGFISLDLVKMDIEGAEKKCLLGTNDWINNVSICAVEIHETLNPGITSRIIGALQSKFDFYLHGEYFVFSNKEVNKIK